MSLRGNLWRYVDITNNVTLTFTGLIVASHFNRISQLTIQSHFIDVLLTYTRFIELWRFNNVAHCIDV
jgi:hypothetical protein